MKPDPDTVGHPGMTFPVIDGQAGVCPVCRNTGYVLVHGFKSHRDGSDLFNPYCHFCRRNPWEDIKRITKKLTIV